MIIENRYLCLGVLILLIAFCTRRKKVSKNISSRTVVKTAEAPEAIGPYSQGIRVGRSLYLAGQIGLNPQTGKLAGEDLESQARQALDNLSAVIEAGGFTLTDIAETQVFLTNIEHFEAFNTIYGEYFDKDPPARAVVEVEKLPLDAKVEIKMTAVR